MIVPTTAGFHQQSTLNRGLDQYYIRTAVASGSYNVTPSDTIVSVTGTTGATIVLPAIATHLKLHQKLLVIVDEGGNAGTNAITIRPAAADSVDGGVAGVDYSLNWDRGALMFYSENATPGWRLMTEPEPASVSLYDPQRPADWEDADPTMVSQALDRLAFGYFLAHGVIPVMPSSGSSTLFVSATSHYGTLPQTVQSQLSGVAAVSLSFWVKRASTGSRDLLLNFTRSGLSSSIEVEFRATGEIRVAARSDGVDALITTTTTTTFLSNVWYNLVAIVNVAADSMSIYVNNVLEITETAKGFNSATFDGALGTRQVIAASATPSLFFDGTMDEVSLWGIAVSVADISELWNGGIPSTLSSHTNFASVLDHWRMGDSDTVPTITDQVGINDITLVNGPTFVLDTP